MTKTSFYAGLKLFVAQAAVQVALHGLGLTMEQACAVTSGVMLLAPLYSETAREVYHQAFTA